MGVAIGEIQAAKVDYGKMKAISIRPPWAWAILHAGKDIENRTWKTKIRGTIAIHASQTMSRPYYESSIKEIRKIAPGAKIPNYDSMVRGAIVGLVEWLAVRNTRNRSGKCATTTVSCSPTPAYSGNLSHAMAD